MEICRYLQVKNSQIYLNAVGYRENQAVFTIIEKRHTQMQINMFYIHMDFFSFNKDDKPEIWFTRAQYTQLSQGSELNANNNYVIRSCDGGIQVHRIEEFQEYPGEQIGFVSILTRDKKIVCDLFKLNKDYEKYCLKLVKHL